MTRSEKPHRKPVDALPVAGLVAVALVTFAAAVGGYRAAGWALLAVLATAAAIGIIAGLIDGGKNG